METATRSLPGGEIPRCRSDPGILEAPTGLAPAEAGSARRWMKGSSVVTISAQDEADDEGTPHHGRSSPTRGGRASTDTPARDQTVHRVTRGHGPFGDVCRIVCLCRLGLRGVAGTMCGAGERQNGQCPSPGSSSQSACQSPQDDEVSRAPWSIANRESRHMKDGSGGSGNRRSSHPNASPGRYVGGPASSSRSAQRGSHDDVGGEDAAHVPVDRQRSRRHLGLGLRLKDAGQSAKGAVPKGNAQKASGPLRTSPACQWSDRRWKRGSAPRLAKLSMTGTSRPSCKKFKVGDPRRQPLRRQRRHHAPHGRPPRRREQAMLTSLPTFKPPEVRIRMSNQPDEAAKFTRYSSFLRCSGSSPTPARAFVLVH